MRVWQESKPSREWVCEAAIEPFGRKPLRYSAFPGLRAEQKIELRLGRRKASVGFEDDSLARVVIDNREAAQKLGSDQPGNVRLVL